MEAYATQPRTPAVYPDDAKHALKQLQPIAYYEEVAVAPGVSARFTRAGQILGSACLELRADGTIAFTGDVGRPVDPIMKPPDPLRPADFLVTESTYGDRRHSTAELHDALAPIISETLERNGVVLVPAFAVGRAQHLLHLVAQLRSAGRIPDVPIYLDSPMAISATGLFCAHSEDHRLSEEECHAMCETARYTQTADESRAISRSSDPMIVISASGMATGGRILHHLKRFLPEEQNTVLFVGYQAAGTRGRSLVDGTDEVKIHGQYVPVRSRIAQMPGLSAHADYREMLDWLAASALSPRGVFVTHGEPSAADAFRRRLHDAFDWKVTVPEMGERFVLGHKGATLSRPR